MEIENPIETRSILNWVDKHPKTTKKMKLRDGSECLINSKNKEKNYWTPFLKLMADSHNFIISLQNFKIEGSKIHKEFLVNLHNREPKSYAEKFKEYGNFK